MSGQYNTQGTNLKFRTNWTYDARDQVATQTYPNGVNFEAGEAVTSSYDVFGRPYSLVGTYSYVSSATYDALGRLDLVTLGSGLQTDYNYYAATSQGGRLSQIRSGSGGSWNTQDLRYQYDAVGNVSVLTDTLNSNQCQEFRYDELDRLTQARAVNGTDAYDWKDYEYNTIGNITSFETITYTYSTSHTHAVEEVGGVDRYSYGPSGQMVSRYWNDTTATLDYDPENRLASISSPSSSFLYDADGGMARQTINGTTTSFAGSWAEYSGATLTKYFLFGGQRIALRTSGSPTYLQSDQVHSTALTTDAWRTTTGAKRYYPFGAARGGSLTATPYLYTSQRYESGLGLYNYGARWYDPAIGRFIQPDTIVPEAGNPQALNRYSYTLNNPIKYTDPTGHWALMEDAAGDYGAFGVRYTSNDQLRVVYGGDYFRNDIELGTANSALGSNYAIPLPESGGLTGPLVYASINNTLAQLEGDSGNASPSYLWDAGFVAGSAQVFGTIAQDVSYSAVAWTVGRANDLMRISNKDGLAVHHVVQKQPASQVIQGYDQKTGPAILVPESAHRSIPKLTGKYTGTARDLLARDIRNLRNIKAPNNALKELINLNKQMHWQDFVK